MKPGPAISALGDAGDRGQLRHDRLGQSARIGAGALGEHHRRVGGEIAMGRIARRLDRDRAAIDAGRQRAFRLEGIEQSVEMRGEAGVERQCRFHIFEEGAALDDEAGDLKRARRAAARRERAIAAGPPPLRSPAKSGLT